MQGSEKIAEIYQKKSGEADSKESDRQELVQLP